MNESMRTDQEDRYSSTKNKQPLLSKPAPKLSKKQWIILTLAIIILLILLSFSFFKPENNEELLSTTAESPEQQIESTNHAINDSGMEDPQYTQLTPPKISTQATETQQKTENEKERVEIPGEITDLLEQKIQQLSTTTEGVALSSENKSINAQHNELPLTDPLEDEHFTIQITASSSLENLLAFVKSNELTNYRIYETKRDNKTWFVLIKGNFSSIEDAKNAMKSLPSNLIKNTPWIKSGANIKKEMSQK